MKFHADSINFLILFIGFDILTDNFLIFLAGIDIFTSVTWGAVLYSFSPSTGIEE